MDIVFLIGLIALLFGVFFRGWSFITANAQVEKYADQDVQELELEAARHTYRGQFLGKHVATGYVKPFEVCDEFVGISYDEVDNSSGSSGDVRVKLHTCGDFNLALTGVTRADIGKAVFATDDETLALEGHALAFVGRVVGVAATNKAIVRLKGLGELPGAEDPCVMFRGGPWSKVTGNDGGATEYFDGDGGIVASALGLGVIPVDNYFQLSLDNTDEASHAGIVTAPKFDPDGGIVFKTKLAAYSVSGTAMTGANVDLEFGLADAVVRTAVDPTYHARFHVDGGGTTLALGADDDTTDVAEADTTLELPKTVATAVEYVIIVKSDGTVTAFADGVQITAPVVTAIDLTGVGCLAAFVNIEKSSAAGVAIVEVLSMECYGALT